MKHPHAPQTNQPEPGSHVTTAPEALPGQNYDPRVRVQLGNEPKVVHTDRNEHSDAIQVSALNRQRHEDSMRRYPHLNLSEGEFVVLDVKRHPIGLLAPILVTVLGIICVVIGLILYPADSSVTSGTLAGLPPYEVILLPALLIMALIGIGGGIALWVYLRNQFYLTNESVVQEIQHSLFSHHEQTVSLGSIEDASFKRDGILQNLLDYGTVRLSTEGDETTYQFSYVANPRNHVAILNNAVESFKNGRPVDPYES